MKYEKVVKLIYEYSKLQGFWIDISLHSVEKLMKKKTFS